MPAVQDGLCRSCRAPILWCKTAKGKNFPLDVDQEHFGLRFLIDNDGYAHHVPAGCQDLGHRSHFATCPNANAHRSPRKKKL